MTDLEAKLLTALNSFCFQQIWNEPLSELRANIVPTMVQERSVTGNVTFNGKTYQLPTNTDPYYVYVIPDTLMYVFVTRQIPDEWISSVDLCNLYDILIHTYHLSGKMLHKGAVYFKKIGSKYLLAINKKMSGKCLTHTQMKDIRFTMYFDSDFVNKITIGSFKVPTIDSSYIYRQQISAFFQQCPVPADHTTVYINGYEQTLQGIASIPLDSYVDVMHDENDLFSFDLDLTVVANNYGFFSEKDKTYKQIVHIPKELNPDNKVLTHNTFDIHVREKRADGVMPKGLYLHRCGQRSVDQITHNDISIPLFILDAYRDYLGTQEITLHISCRQHDKDNILMRDKNYIDLLYTQDDTTILQCLTGKVRADLDFWKAVNLEQSVYVRMMFDIPNVLTSSSMYDFVEGLGYYHVLALLCKKIIHTDISAWYEQTLSFPKPYLFAGQAVYPFVYKGNTKIHQDLVGYGQDNMDVITSIDAAAGLVPGDKLTVEMFVDGSTNIYTITPVSGASQVTIPYTDYTVLEEFTNELLPVKGLDLTVTKSLKQITSFTGNIVATSTTEGIVLTFGPTMYGRTFVIQPNIRVYKWTKNIDSLLNDGEPIYLNLHHPVRDGSHEVPIWYTPHCRVYLNSRYLIEGLDFSVQSFHDAVGNLAIKQICLHNLEYLQATGNVVEWFATGAEEENKVHGYIVDNQGAVPDDLALLFENMTMVHVDGRYEQAVVNLGNRLGVPEGVYRQGAPYQACTTVPKVIQNFLSKYHPNDDITRLQILKDYFYGKQPDLPAIVVMSYSHRCFSNFVVTVIRDLLNGTLKGISFDPDDERMKAQFTAYNYLQERDLVFSGQYDLNYVDVFPHYKQIVVPDTSVYQILQAFIRLVMPQDSVTSGEIYYGN